MQREEERLQRQGENETEALQKILSESAKRMVNPELNEKERTKAKEEHFKVAKVLRERSRDQKRRQPRVVPTKPPGSVKLDGFEVDLSVLDDDALLARTAAVPKVVRYLWSLLFLLFKYFHIHVDCLWRIHLIYLILLYLSVCLSVFLSTNAINHSITHSLSLSLSLSPSL